MDSLRGGSGKIRWTIEPTGQTALPNPWGGIKSSEHDDGSVGILTHTLPSAIYILVPVFVISKDVTIDVINFLLESSWFILTTSLPDEPEKPKGSFIHRFIVPPIRNPQFLLGPTDWPMSSQAQKFPFVGLSLKDLLAAWIGTDQASIEDGVPPFRKGTDKPRHWSPNSFLVLDEQTMVKGDMPTGLMVYLPRDSTNESDVQTLRCELPVTLRFNDFLSGGGKNAIPYVKDRLVGEDGVLRTKAYDEWFKEGGQADKEAEEGRMPVMDYHGYKP